LTTSSSYIGKIRFKAELLLYCVYTDILILKKCSGLKKIEIFKCPNLEILKLNYHTQPDGAKI